MAKCKKWLLWFVSISQKPAFQKLESRWGYLMNDYSKKNLYQRSGAPFSS